MPYISISSVALLTQNTWSVQKILLTVVFIFVFGCGKAGMQEHEAGVFLAKSLYSYVCQSEVKDFSSPCGSIDVRYEASPQALIINVYGIYAPSEILELVTLVRQTKEAKGIRFKITVNFYRNIGSHTLVRSAIIGE